jgi:hypothetical protein
MYVYVGAAVCFVCIIRVRVLNRADKEEVTQEAPGQLITHYAPDVPTFLITGSVAAGATEPHCAGQAGQMQHNCQNIGGWAVDLQGPRKATRLVGAWNDAWRMLKLTLRLCSTVTVTSRGL